MRGTRACWRAKSAVLSDGEVQRHIAQFTARAKQLRNDPENSPEKTKLGGRVQEVFEKLRADGSKLGPLSHGEVVRCQLLLGNYAAASRMFYEMLRRNIQPHPQLAVTLLTAAARNDDHFTASAALRVAKASGRSPRILLRAYTGAIWNFGRQGHEAKALDLFERVALEMLPDVGMFNALLFACQSPERRAELVLRMRRGGLVPTEQTYGILLHKQTVVQEAEQLFHTMANDGVAKTERLYGALLGCYRTAGDVAGMFGVLQRCHHSGFQLSSTFCTAFLMGLHEAAVANPKDSKRLIKAAELGFQFAINNSAVTSETANPLFKLYLLRGEVAASRQLWTIMKHLGIRPTPYTRELYALFGEEAAKEARAERAQLATGHVTGRKYTAHFDGTLRGVKIL